MDIRKFFKTGPEAIPAGNKASTAPKSKAPGQSPVAALDTTKDQAAPGSGVRAADPGNKGQGDASGLLDVAAEQSNQPARLSFASPGAKRAKASPQSAAGAKKPAASKTATKNRTKKLVLDDSSDEDMAEAKQSTEKGDTDFQVDLTGVDDEDSDGWQEDVSDEEIKPPSKKRKAASKTPPSTKPKSPAKSSRAKGAKAEGDDGEEGKPSAAKKARSTPAAKKTPSGAAKKAAGKGPLAGLAPDALEAVEAVDAAAQKLPGEEELGVSFMAEGSFNQRAPDEPAHWGQKEAPRGHPDCLTGKTFVVSGVLDSLKRDEATDFVKRHGGKVTGNVSSRTSFLVVGQFCGRSKYTAAKQHSTPIINEDGLFSLVAAAPDPTAMQEDSKAQQGQQQQQQGPESAAAAVKQETAPMPAQHPSSAPQQAQHVGVAASAPGSFYSSSGSKAPASAPAPALAALNSLGRTAPPPASKPAAAGPSGAAGTQLWVEKWRPKVAHDLVGNGTLVGTLRQWLRGWEAVHLHGAQPSGPPSGGSGARRDKLAADLKKKAVLLSGPPGIGKTTSALIMCRELGFEPVEVNASDTRGKADSSVLKGVGGKLANAVKELSTNLAISYDAAGRRKKLCLIMDEVDGMSAGDRGGVADLIQTIHKTKVPIIAICNDKYSPKLKSLRNHTLELDFRKPTAQQISKRMLDICREEGLQINQATMEALAQSANGDIRLVLGQLQMVRLRAKALSYDQVKKGGMGTAKDFEMSPFEAARKLLSFDCDTLSLGDQIDLVFQDMDLVPLLVQENYVNHRPRLAQSDISRLQIMAKAADSFSGGDVVTRRVRQYQSWSLMPFACALGTVTPAAWMRGGRDTFGLFPGETNFPRFTAWLGNNSSQGKQRRLMGELHTRMLSSGVVEADRTGMRLSYLPVLRNTLVRPLVREGKEGIPAVLRQMRDYCLSREDIDFITDVTKWKGAGGWKEDPMKQVETQTKSAFTRAFTQQHIKPKTGFGLEDGVGKKKGKGRGKAAAAADEEGELEGGLAEAAEVAEGASPPKTQQEEEEEEMDPVLIRQKAMALKSRGLTLTLKDGSEHATGRGAKSGGGGGGARRQGGGGGAAGAGGRPRVAAGGGW